MIFRHLTKAALCFVVLPLVSCSREEPVRVYEVIVPPAARATESSADPDSAAQAAANAVATPAQAAPAADRVRWSAPAAWEARPLSQFINKGHYALPGEGPGRPVLTISAYPGTAGGLGANLNRWRGQIGLATLNEEEMRVETEAILVGGQEIILCSFNGQQSDGTLWATDGAVIALPGETWFFKLVGDPVAVEAVRGAFREFILALQIGDAGQAATPTAAPAPNPPATAPAAARPQYSTPAGWIENPPGGMREASFTIAGDDGLDADVSLVRMGGGGARDSQNVNLWRQQLGLPELPEAEAAAQLQALRLGANELRLFDTTSEAAMLNNAFKARILAAILEKDGTTWVLRARGAAPHLEAERERFLQLAESLRLP